MRLGDSVRDALGFVGITSERIEEWLGEPCGCEERRLKLNSLGAWAERVVAGKIERAEEYLLRIIGANPKMITLDNLVASLPRPNIEPSPPPPYTGTSSKGIGLAVQSMSEHMTDEGWQIFEGLEHNGYTLCGYNLPVNETNGFKIVKRTNPGVAVIQDKREWDVRKGDFRDRNSKFERLEAFRDRSDIFKVTILKDAQQRPWWHKESADEMGAHAWIIYYHPEIVLRLAPYVRRDHIIRTYHSVNPLHFPVFNRGSRKNALLSGAISGAYPLRTKLVEYCRAGRLKGVVHVRHPGYHRKGCASPGYYQQLNGFKASICTASRYGYALRKIIEATASGCVVVTDLPREERLPGIDDNLVRIPSPISPNDLNQILQGIFDSYDISKQEALSQTAKELYSHDYLTRRIIEDIETLRKDYK